MFCLVVSLYVEFLKQGNRLLTYWACQKKHLSNGRFVPFQERGKWTPVFNKMLPFSIFLIDNSIQYLFVIVIENNEIMFKAFKHCIV